MQLIIDIGNTLIKSYVFEQDQIVDQSSRFQKTIGITH